MFNKMDMNLPKISVIVPVYNVENYLRECVESILKQEYIDFELLLIDDGSTDRSGKICDEYIEKDSRVKVYHTSNHGVSSARNLGIECSKAPWICFVDSDDLIDEKYLSVFRVDELLPSCLAIQGIEMLERKTGSQMWSITYPNAVLPEKKLGENISKYDLLSHGFPVAKLLSKELIVRHRLYFNTSLSFHEDHLFVLQYIQHIKTIILIPGMNYKYIYDGSESLSKRLHSNTEMEMAYTLLFHEYFKVIKHFDIVSCVNLAKFEHFLYQIRIKAIMACYIYRQDKAFRMNYLKKVHAEKNIIKRYYKPYSIKGKILKRILLYIPVSMQDYMFRFMI